MSLKNVKQIRKQILYVYEIKIKSFLHLQILYMQQIRNNDSKLRASVLKCLNVSQAPKKTIEGQL